MLTDIETTLNQNSVKETNKIFSVEVKFDVKTYDIDAAGHVNNIAYVRWLEDLRVKLFDQFLPVSQLLEHDEFPVVAETNISYKRQIKLSDKPVGKMWIQKIEKVVWSLKAEIIVEGKIAAKADQKCVLVNLKTNKMVLPPNEFLSKYYSAKISQILK